MGNCNGWNPFPADRMRNLAGIPNLKFHPRIQSHFSFFFFFKFIYLRYYFIFLGIARPGFIVAVENGWGCVRWDFPHEVHPHSGWIATASSWLPVDSGIQWQTSLSLMMIRIRRLHSAMSTGIDAIQIGPPFCFHRLPVSSRAHKQPPTRNGLNIQLLSIK